MTPRLVAVDPGSRETALVVVEPAPRGKVALIAARMVTSDVSALNAAIADWSDADHVAIEWAQHVFANRASMYVLQTQEAAARVETLAHLRGMRVMKVAASVWRAAVVGKVAMTTTTVFDKKTGAFKKKRRGVEKTDALVARAIGTFVDGLERSNVHVRDALGLAVYAAREVWKRGGVAA